MMTTTASGLQFEDTVPGTGSGLAQTLSVYGRVAASQYPGSGVYNDTVVVTVTY